MIRYKGSKINWFLLSLWQETIFEQNMENYIVSARKYRPDTFESVVSQKSLTTTLKNAIQTGKISNRLKQLINDPKNFSKFKGLIKANNKDHLKELIEIS